MAFYLLSVFVDELPERSLLSAEEVAWLDAYHRDVFDRVSPLLPNDSPAVLEWLRDATSPLLLP